MIEQAVRRSGWQQGDCIILPADIADAEAMLALPALLPDPNQTVMLATIYDEWGEEKVARMSKLGFSVEILWRRAMSQRATSGTEVRRLMAAGSEWRHLVPAGVAETLGAESVAPE